MSGAQTSTGTDPNILLRTLSGQQTADVYGQQLANQQNQLLQPYRVQAAQQDVGSHDIEMAARVSQSLLGLPDEAAMAAAYPGAVANAQQYGYLKNAPSAFPGKARLQQLALMGVPSIDQYKQGRLDQANRALLGDQTGQTTTAEPPAAPAYTPTGTIEPDALTRATAVRDGLIKRGLDPDTATAFAANALHESSANPNTGSGDAGASHGLFQWRDARATAYQQTFGHAPDNAPLDEQLDNVVRELSTTEGAAKDRIAAAQGPAAKAAAVSQYYLRPKDVGPEMQRRGGTALQLASQLGGSGQPAGGGQVILGDSYASKDGLGGSGVVGAHQTDVLGQIQTQAKSGALRGKPVVISTGAVNDGGDTSRVAEQIQAAKAGEASGITVVGVADGAPQSAATNARLQQIAQANGARFVPAGPVAADGIHPANYAPLRQAVRLGGAATAGPGAGAPAASTAPAAGAPDLVGPRPLPPMTANAPVVTPQSLANTPVPQVAQNQVMPGQPNGAPLSPQQQAQAQQPPAPQQARPQLPGAPVAGFGPRGEFTAPQAQELRSLQLSGTPTATIAQRMDEMRQHNDTLTHQAYADAAAVEQRTYERGRNVQTDRLALEAALRTQAEETFKQQQHADPVQGTGEKADADRILFRYADQIADGTAKPEVRRLYAQGAQYYLKGQMQWISDPSDPTKSIMVQVPGQMPVGFPHPSYKPGDQPPTPPSTATKSDFKPLPDNERKLLIDASTRLDQINEQRSTFKPDFAGFGIAALGEAANVAARNLPASPTAVARAEWWQNYQRMKLAVRQGISGQSLTASELAEFDKADINPGMAPDLIKANLAHQDQIVRTAHERRIRSLAADRYSPDAIKEAGGIDPATATEHLTGAATPKAPPPAQPPPPGFKVFVP